MKPTLYQVDGLSPYRLAVVARPRGGDWLCDEIRGLSFAGVDVLVSMLTDEEAQELGLANEPKECGVASIEFFNVPLRDRSVPANAMVFLRSVDALATAMKSGKFVAVHCRASIGRASVMAVSILARLGWNIEDAFEAVQSARGCVVPDTPEQRQWVIDHVPIASH
jgi:protein-tyrosine phosphatase